VQGGNRWFFANDLVSLFQVDGKTYALPKDQGSLALFINNDSDIQRVGAFMLQNGNNIVDNGKAVFNQDSGVSYPRLKPLGLSLALPNPVEHPRRLAD
jgi:hypothetical protein